MKHITPAEIFSTARARQRRETDRTLHRSAQHLVLCLPFALGLVRVHGMASSSSASSSASVLPSWPPKLSEQQTASLAAQATDYALAHGLIYRPIGNPPSSTHAHHAPISLFPSPFPRSAFTTALGLQPILNELYARVALDDAFLEKVIGGNVAKVDDFQKELWNIYKTVKSEGKQPVSSPDQKTDISMPRIIPYIEPLHGRPTLRRGLDCRCYCALFRATEACEDESSEF